MDNSLVKKLLLTIFVLVKPPVFLTLSILFVIIYLTFVIAEPAANDFIDVIFVSKDLSDPILIFQIFLSLFGAVWVYFFYTFVNYEFSVELEYYFRVFHNSRKGFRFLPVIVLHLISVIIIEYATYRSICNSLIKTKDNKNLDYKQDSKTFNAVLVYTLWTSAIIYSIVYLLFEEIVILFFGDETLTEYLHSLFVRLFVKFTGIDLSNLPIGESLQNSPVERLMNQLLSNEDFTSPSRAEYDEKVTEILSRRVKRSNEKKRKLEHLSWNTLR